MPDFFHAAESPGVARDAFIPKSAQRIAFSRVQLASQSSFKECLADDFALRGVLASFNSLLDKFSQSGLRVGTEIRYKNVKRDRRGPKREVCLPTHVYNNWISCAFRYALSGKCGCTG